MPPHTESLYKPELEHSLYQLVQIQITYLVKMKAMLLTVL